MRAYLNRSSMRLAASLQKLRALLGAEEILAFGGLALVGAGVALMHVPLALIVVGATLFWLGVLR